MQTVIDFERGFDDFRRGLRCCPFTVTSRVECWRDGWLTAQRTFQFGLTIAATIAERNAA